jgi:hypothetical protein
MGIMQHSMHDADQAVVAAFEDSGSDASLLTLNPIPASDHPEELSTVLFDTNLGGDDAEDIFTGASEPYRQQSLNIR